MTASRRKLIEVSLPLDAINRASARGEVDSARPSGSVNEFVEPDDRSRSLTVGHGILDTRASK